MPPVPAGKRKAQPKSVQDANTSSNSKRSSGSTANSKSFKIDEPVWNSFIEYQKQPDELVSTCDVHLVVSNGDIVPVHAFVLQSVSTFFDDIFSTQREAFYFGPRLVLLPDFSSSEVLKLIEFIYTGVANFASDKESESFKALMKAFGISDKKTSLTKIRQATNPPESKATKGRIIPTSRSIKTEDKTQLYVVKKRNVKLEYSSSKVGDRKLPVKRPYQKGSSSESPSESDSDTGFNEELDKKVKDKEWYYTQLRKCQHCNKEYQSAVDASHCITHHQRFRCYFCFAVEKTTESLYAHYDKKHRKAPARDGYIICAFCEQPTASRSVSSHVISVHLNDPHFRNGPAPGPSANAGAAVPAPTVGRPVRVNRNKSKSPSPKRTKTNKKQNGSSSSSTKTRNKNKENETDDDENKPLQVPDLLTVLQKKSLLGNMRTYTCEDDRSEGREPENEAS